MRLDADACRRNSRNLLTISGKPMGFSVIVVLDEVPTSTPAGSFTPALQPCPIDCWYASPVNRARAEAPRASLSPGNLRSPRNRSDWRHAVARTRAVPAATSRYTPDCRFGLSFQPATAATTRKAPHAAQRDATTYTAWKTSRRRNQLVSISMRSSSGPTTPWQTLANRCSTNSRGSYRTGADNNTLIGAAKQGTIDLPTPQGRAEAEKWLEAMVSAALADGKITREEGALLMSTGRRIGLVEYDIRALLTRVRQQRYAAAKDALRGASPIIT